MLEVEFVEDCSEVEGLTLRSGHCADGGKEDVAMLKLEGAAS